MRVTIAKFYSKRGGHRYARLFVQRIPATGTKPAYFLREGLSGSQAHPRLCRNRLYRFRKIDHIVNGKEFHAKKGDLLFLNYNSVHSFKPLCPSTYYNISFYPEILEKIITPENAFSLLSLSTFNEISKETNEGLVSFNAHEQRIVKNILDAIAEEQSKHLPRFAVINESYMNILITMILRKTSLPDEPETNAWNELADYISDNLDSDLSLEALAKKCFYKSLLFLSLIQKQIQDLFGRIRLQ